MAPEVSGTPDLPPRLSELTADWLTEVLRVDGTLPRGAVRSLEFELIGTFTNEVWRLRPSYDGGASGAPESFVLKRPYAPRQRDSEDFASEIRFYRELSARLPVRTPRFHFGELDGERSLLLLEEVRGLEHFSFRRGADPGHARAGIEALARMHAHCWQRVEGLDWVVKLSDAEQLATWQDQYDRGWREGRSGFDAVVPGFAPIGEALLGRLAASLAPLAAPATLLHGDAHAENLPARTRDDGTREVVFLDWPGPRLGSAGFDVAVFVVMSLPVDERRESERELVAAHAEVAQAGGAHYSVDPWLDYRRGVLRRAARIVEIAHSFQTGDPVTNAALRMVSERCLTAAVDLRVDELIQ